MMICKNGNAEDFTIDHSPAYASVYHSPYIKQPHF